VQEEAEQVEQVQRSGLRTLMQAGTSITATVVTSPLQLLEAVKRGDEHIEIKNHLDLTPLQPLGEYLLGNVSSTVKSIRVR
jgi:hypothetical protein